MVDYFTDFQKGQISKSAFIDKVRYAVLFFAYLAIVVFTATYVYMAAWVYTGATMIAESVVNIPVVNHDRAMSLWFIQLAICLRS